MESEFKVGDIVISSSGHDKNNLFIVVSIDKSGFLTIINGKTRKKDNPKTKNPKHLVKIGHDEAILKLVSCPIVTNAEIYKKIKQYKVKE